jgi:hypothetical protein
MEISYQLEPADTLAAYSRRFRAGGRLAVALTFGFLALLALSTWAHARDSHIPFLAGLGLALLNFLIPAAVFVLALWAANRWVRRQTVRLNRAEFCRHTITLADDALVEQTDHNESRTRWSAVHRVEATADHILIYLTPALVHTIPRRAFSTEAEMRRFVDRATWLRQQAQTAR